MSGEGRVDGRCAVHLDCLGTDQHADGADLGAASPDTRSPHKTGGRLLDVTWLAAS
jgi:hypothetical protein